MTVQFIEIDFAAKSWTSSNGRLKLITLLLGSVGLILCLSSVWQVFVIFREEDALKKNLVIAQSKIAESAEKVKTIKPSSISQSDANAVNNVIQRLNLPWLQILDSVETATPNEVALLALEPDAKKNILKGLAESKTTDEMVSYIQSMNEQKFFHTVTLSRHEVNSLDANKPIRFQFEASWLGGEK
ncbi:hypothetical protein D3C72_344570 [compost metagenome]